MSELKSVYIDRTGDWVRSGNDTGKLYLKSEADKVIAEKDAKILARACVPFSQIIEVKYGEKT